MQVVILLRKTSRTLQWAPERGSFPCGLNLQEETVLFSTLFPASVRFQGLFIGCLLEL